MTRIRLTRPTGVDGVGYPAGTEIEVDASLAQALALMGKAQVLEPAPRAPKVETTQAPEPEEKATAPAQKPRARSRRRTTTKAKEAS